jgi:hypothetical protein
MLSAIFVSKENVRLKFHIATIETTSSFCRVSPKINPAGIKQLPYFLMIVCVYEVFDQEVTQYSYNMYFCLASWLTHKSEFKTRYILMAVAMM